MDVKNIATESKRPRCFLPLSSLAGQKLPYCHCMFIFLVKVTIYINVYIFTLTPIYMNVYMCVHNIAQREHIGGIVFSHRPL